MTTTERKKKTKWQCDDCYEYFNSKKALVEHLVISFEEAAEIADTVQHQLDDMGIKDPYKYL